MNGGYSAKAVANYFLERYMDEGITPLKIQKLVYIAHGWHLALEQKPLVNDEYAEAWQFGPVFASLYHEFKHIGREPILELATETYLDQDGKPKTKTPRVREDDKDVRDILDRIWEVYGGYSASQLSAMCHRQDSPWHEVHVRDKSRNAHIPNERIKIYYEGKMTQEQNDD